jgi:hypothetical protein
VNKSDVFNRGGCSSCPKKPKSLLALKVASPSDQKPFRQTVVRLCRDCTAELVEKLHNELGER